MSCNEKRVRATVRRGLLQGRTGPECLSLLDAVCTRASACPAVHADPVAREALSALVQSLRASQTALLRRRATAAAIAGAQQAMRAELAAARRSYATYQGAVDALAAGNPRVIRSAGLAALVRDPLQPDAAPVRRVRGEPGSRRGTAIIGWERVPGAKRYVVQVNLTPENPRGWRTLAICRARYRRRRVRAAPGQRFLVRVAALGAGGRRGEWTTAGVRAK